MDSSDGAGETRGSEAALGDVATSDRDEVPGLCFIFLEGEGVSRGPGVDEARPSFDLVSSEGFVSHLCLKCNGRVGQTEGVHIRGVLTYLHA